MTNLQSLARIAVAQICDSVGLQGFQQSSLDILSDVTCKYIQDIGKTSNFCANSAGRTESNVFDVVHGLEDLGLSPGFLGASDIHHFWSNSGVIKKISRYVGVYEVVEFAYSVPSFPVIKEQQSTLSFFHSRETPPGDNIPPWLPCFPDPKTHTSPTSASMEQTAASHDIIDQDQEVIGPSLLKLERRVACNGFQVPTVVEQGHNGGREQVNNPFLASPLENGEKEVSLVSLPARLMEEDVAQNHSLWAKHVSAMAAFALAIQEFTSSDLDIEEGSKEAVVEKRPAVQLKFHMSKKPLHTAIKVSHPSWFAHDDPRDNPKKRKEKVVKGSLENGKHTDNDAVVN